MWVVGRLQKWSDFTTTIPIPHSITVDPGKMIGYLAIYATEKEAREDWPEGPFFQVKKYEDSGEIGP